MHLISFNGSYKRNLKRMGIDLSTLTPINYKTEIFNCPDNITNVTVSWTQKTPTMYLIDDDDIILALKLCDPSNNMVMVYNVDKKALQFLKLVNKHLLHHNRKNSILLIVFTNTEIDTNEIDTFRWSCYNPLPNDKRLYRILKCASTILKTIQL